MLREKHDYDDNTVHYEFCGYSYIDIQWDNYNGKVKKIIQDPDTLLGRQGSNMGRVFGFIPVDLDKRQEITDRQKMYEQSYKGQLQLFREEKLQHLKWITQRRGIAIFATLILSFVIIYLFLLLLIKPDDIFSIMMVSTPILTAIASTLIILLQRKPADEKRYREQKARNKKALDDWYFHISKERNKG